MLFPANSLGDAVDSTTSSPMLSEGRQSLYLLAKWPNIGLNVQATTRKRDELSGPLFPILPLNCHIMFAMAVMT